jgi:hypothetical protein
MELITRMSARPTIDDLRVCRGYAVKHDHVIVLASYRPRLASS